MGLSSAAEVSSTKPIIGLVGCGLLGSAIADRLAAAGFGVVAFDVDCARLDAVKAKRVETAASLADVAGRCRRIVLSLPDSDVVADVVEGDSGLAMGARRPTILIDTTTGDPEASGALAGRLETAGIAYLDAPVAGSSAQLRQGEAALIVGGDADALAACNDIFAALCDRMFHTGPAGSGARTKLLINQVLGLNRLVLAEALALADKLGMDAARLLDILKVTPAYSCVMDSKGDKMLAGDFVPQARLAQHRKDVGLILSLAERAGMELPVSTLHARLLDRAVKAGLGTLDNSAIIRVLTDETV